MDRFHQSSAIDWLKREKELWASGKIAITGVDEAGRGCLAGPVVAAAVILKVGIDLNGIIDSKQMTPKEREEGYDFILHNCQAVSLYAASAKVIDRVNILRATMQAMKGAIRRLKIEPDYILIDGNRCPDSLPCHAESIIGGDSTSRSIAAASVLAKVTRDRLMMKLDKLYPKYGFASHKGYATAFHCRMLKQLPPTPHHRFSFAPVRQYKLDIPM